MSDELAVKSAPFRLGVKLTGLAARKAAAIENGAVLELSAAEMQHRIGIVFDDSGSMGAQQTLDAKEGCEEFLRACEKDKTAVAVYPMTAEPILLSKHLPAIAIMIRNINGCGGTPLVQTTLKMLADNNLTRAIVFSDGQPNKFTQKEYERLQGFQIPIDTVYIPANYVDSTAAEFMAKLAKDTGGIYLQFEHGKSNFRTAFKYLSPGLRYMLADKSFVQKLEGR